MNIHRISANEINFAVYEWGDASAPVVIFLHATGFHGRCWTQVINHLDGLHCYAVDARGHGHSNKPAPPYSWQQMGEDAAEIIRQLGLTGAIGVGHSIGGNSLTRAAASVPDAFAALLLIDPVIFPAPHYQTTTYSIDNHFVLQRRTYWTSPDEMFSSFLGRGPFINWKPEVLRDYCNEGILPSEDGYVLACSPEVEAHTYMSSNLAQNVDIYEAIKQVQVPVRVLRCAEQAKSPRDLMLSPTNPELAAHFSQGEDVILHGYSHFIPMEAPELTAQHIREMVEKSM